MRTPSREDRLARIDALSRLLDTAFVLLFASASMR
jgi:hypothetical protein